MNFIKRRNHKRTILLICILLYPLIHVQADADSLHRKVEAFGIVLPQEKVYLHLDNTCYFLGDTIWYKGYVTQSNTGTLTTMSRILYVELLTPDGYLVERQQLEMPDGMANGMFVLEDSLYAGYYELRAYTRWMLNFGKCEYPHIKDTEHRFYSKNDGQRVFPRLREALLPRLPCVRQARGCREISQEYDPAAHAALLQEAAGTENPNSTCASIPKAATSWRAPRHGWHSSSTMRTGST